MHLHYTSLQLCRQNITSNPINFSISQVLCPIILTSTPLVLFFNFVSSRLHIYSPCSPYQLFVTSVQSSHSSPMPPFYACAVCLFELIPFAHSLFVVPPPFLRFHFNLHLLLSAVFRQRSSSIE